MSTPEPVRAFKPAATKLVRRWQRSAYALPVAAVMAIVLLFISESSYRQGRNASDALNARTALRVDVRHVLDFMSDAEIGQSGYLLTGRSEYLEPYRRALDGLPGALDRLNANYAAQGRPGGATAPLGELVGRRLSLIAETIRLYDAGEHDRWRELMLSNIGKEQRDAIRAMADQLFDAEAPGIARAHKDIDDGLLIGRIGIGVMSVLSLLLLALHLRQRTALESQRGALRESVRAELQAKVDTGNRELAELARHLLTAREDERHRLARAMHDELGALLTAAKLDATRIRMRVATVSPEALERVEHLNETLNSIVVLTRSITEDLRPSSLGTLGLVPALEILAREFAASADVRVDCALQTVALTPQCQLTAYRLVQEALTNISKYARAHSVQVRLAPVAGQAIVSVTDDGVGFDAGGTRMGSYGLLGMRYRVEGEGGRLDIESAPGRGTCLRATLPLEAQA